MGADSSPATIGLWLVALRSFFELCAREGWAAVPERPLIYREDFPRHVRRLPRFIAEDVLKHLNAHLDDLRPVYRGMTLVLEESGMRIGELCTLRLECLPRARRGITSCVTTSPSSVRRSRSHFR